MLYLIAVQELLPRQVYQLFHHFRGREADKECNRRAPQVRAQERPRVLGTTLEIGR